jgi:large subunit ribosomal protein L30
MRVKITLVKSPLGRKPNQRRTVEALGLRKMRQTVEHELNDPIQGMINAVSHLVSVEEVKK